MHERRHTRRRAGFTLIEVAITAALLGIVLGGATMVVSSSQGAFDDSTSRGHASSVTRQTLEHCARELSVAGLATLAPDPVTANGTSQITFTPIIGAGAAAPVFDNPRTLRLAYSPTDPNNGADDDGDGVVDNCRLELVLDVGTLSQRTVVLGNHVREYYAGETFEGTDQNGNGLVDERGFHVTRTGSLLTIRICVEEPGRGGTTLVESMETSIDIRN